MVEIIFRKAIVMVVMIIAISAVSCRKEDSIINSTSTQVTQGEEGEIKGFFLLNEGNLGSNKASLDYFNYTTGSYSKNIYAERNPNVASELGDVGNDIKIWGSRLYIVVNGSNLVEVMSVDDAQHIGAVSIPNCRYVAFSGAYAYVSSYAGEVELNDPNARRGYVAKIDTATLDIVSTCDVGYQPEELVVVDDRLYVANSGGYMAPDYDNTISVIDLDSFTTVDQIEVAINLHRIVCDDYGKLWVSSRGNYSDIASKIFSVEISTSEVVEYPLLAASNMTIVGDSLYMCSGEYNSLSTSTTVSYALVDVSTGRTVTRNFVDESISANITVPYGIAVNPSNREIFITDAGDYVTPGKLYCFDKDGELKWSVTTGDIPAHIAFTTTALEPLD